MKYFNKVLCSLAAIILLCFSVQTAVFAADKNEKFDKIQFAYGGIMSISHYGDTAFYPANSLEGVESAIKKGADMVSVSVRKTSDGVFVLLDTKELSSLCDTDEKDIGAITSENAKKLKLIASDKSVSDCKVAFLEEAIDAVSGKAILILDNAWEFRDEICNLIKEKDAEKSVMLRTFESAKKILQFKQESQTEVSVIGIYDGNIVFNAISHLNLLSREGEGLTQYQSKNFFNVMYQSIVSSRYSLYGNARAAAPAYDPDLCGQREDSIVGWDDLISRGFSVIETNCIEELTAYIKQCESCSVQLEKLNEKAGAVDRSAFSSVSAKNLETAIANAESCVLNRNTSLSSLQNSLSSLDKALNSLSYKTEDDTQKGSLNVTSGKIAATVIFGLLILAAQIYVHKMQKKKQ